MSKYNLKNMYSINQDKLYSPWFSSEKNDFGFELHQGTYKGVWVLINGESIKEVDGKMVFDYEIIRNWQNLPGMVFQSEDFLNLVQKIINEIFSKVWEWENNKNKKIIDKNTHSVII
jgi:hypothetical protein